jgi:pimeloyl-ACP methyl ester carboxylesterase
MGEDGLVQTADRPEPVTASFRTPDGVEIVFDTWTGTKPLPVLLHHGFAADAANNWVGPGVVRALTNAGRTVIALDARGHGRSDKPHEPSAYGHEQMSRDVSSLIDHLELAAVDLVGYSMGGYVAALTAAGGEARLRSVVIGGIGGPALRGSAIDRSAIAAALVAEDPKTVADVNAQQFRRFADSTGGDRHALAAIMRGPFHPVTGLENIAIPALVLVGREDRLATEPEQLAAATPGAQLVITPGDHLSAVAQPEYAAAIETFLASLDNTAAPS